MCSLLEHQEFLLTLVFMICPSLRNLTIKIPALGVFTLVMTAHVLFLLLWLSWHIKCQLLKVKHWYSAEQPFPQAKLLSFDITKAPCLIFAWFLWHLFLICKVGKYSDSHLFWKFLVLVIIGFHVFSFS